MNKEIEKEPNDKISNENYQDKEKIISNFNPTDQKEPQEIHMQSHIANLQNSASKNFKSEIRVEPANLFL
jgi:hypothetical protein